MSAKGWKRIEVGVKLILWTPLILWIAHDDPLLTRVSLGGLRFLWALFVILLLMDVIVWLLKCRETRRRA